MKKIILILFVLIIIPACGPSQEAVATQISAALTAIPTQTPYPTYTPFPTATNEPTATATPVFAVWNANDVANLFFAANIGVGESRKMETSDYGIAPMVAKEGVRFFIPSICPDCGGRIFSFSTQEELDILRRYYESLGKKSAALYSWVFVKGNILVQINGQLPEDQAMKYKEIIENMK